MQISSQSFPWVCVTKTSSSNSRKACRMTAAVLPEKPTSLWHKDTMLYATRWRGTGGYSNKQLRASLTKASNRPVQLCDPPILIGSTSSRMTFIALLKIRYRRKAMKQTGQKWHQSLVTRPYLPRDVISPSSDSNDVLISLNVAPWQTYYKKISIELW